MYLLYSIVTLVVFVVVSPYFLCQALRHRKYVGSLGQRLGYLPVSFNLDGEESIWVHAVSVGEVLTARPLVTALQAEYPNLRVFLSTTTRTGQQLARRGALDVDAVFYFPFDWTFTARRTLALVKPRLFVMMETEIWPNLLRECRRQGIRTALVNGRISSRSFPRYRLVRRFFGRVLGDIDCFCVQSEATARRLAQLGADPARITVTGSLKFDSLDAHAPVPNRGHERVLRFFRLSPERVVIVAGSTLKGEEEAVIRAFNRLRASGAAGTLLILAPRHPERCADVDRLCRQEGLTTVRRSDLPIDAEPRADVVVVDTIGELAQLYQLATAAFVGGSLVPAGGHNIIEPAVFGKSIVFGPHMENFAEIAARFVADGAAVQVASGAELEEAVLSLVGDPVRRARLGAAAHALVEANRGAKERTLAAITELLPPAARETPGMVRRLRLVQ